MPSSMSIVSQDASRSCSEAGVCGVTYLNTSEFLPRAAVALGLRAAYTLSCWRLPRYAVTSNVFTFPNIYVRRYYATELQRLYRGHLGRKRVRRMIDAKYAAMHQAVRHYAAGVVQRHFKGFYSRKHIHDFYARKAYVRAVAAKGEQLRAEMEQQLKEQLQKRLDEEETKARAEFDRTTQQLHHLVSTKAQPGVYNPPYAATMADVPSAFGVPLETHLRIGSLRYIRTHGLHPESTAGSVAIAAAGGAGDVASASMGRTVAALGDRNVTLVPSYVQSDKKSLQATAPYDAPLVAARHESRYQKLMNLDQKPFVAGAKAHHFEGPQPVGVNAAVPFTESWLLSRNSREVEHLLAKDQRVSEKPYVSQSSRSSRLFEDTERKRAAFAASLLACDQAAATLAHTSVIRAGNTLTRPGGLGNTMARTSAPPPATSSSMGTHPSSQPSTSPSSSADPAAFAYVAYPAGAGVAAVRKARDANAPSSSVPPPPAAAGRKSSNQDQYSDAGGGNRTASSSASPPATVGTNGFGVQRRQQQRRMPAAAGQGGLGATSPPRAGRRPGPSSSASSAAAAAADPFLGDASDYESKEQDDLDGAGQMYSNAATRDGASSAAGQQQQQQHDHQHHSGNGSRREPLPPPSSSTILPARPPAMRPGRPLMKPPRPVDVGLSQTSAAASTRGR